MLRCCIILLFVAATASASVHHAIKHHSSAPDAAHHGVEHKNNRWIVQPGTCESADHLASALNTHLTLGSVHFERATRTGFWVFRADASVNPEELATLLVSEKRAGTIELFHRDGVAVRKSH